MSGRAPKGVVIGVGAAGGLGGALARKFAAEGRHVLVAGRTLEKVSRVAARIEEDGGSATAVQTDATSAEDVGVLFDLALRDDDLGAPADLVAFNVGNNMPRSRLEVTPEVFEKFWRTNCLAGFLVAREAAARFAPLGRGTVIFTGATGSLRGAAGYAHFASSKAGLRMIAQSMAREFGRKGIHVAHVIIDGAIDGERLQTRFPEFLEMKGPGGALKIEAIAETYWHIHQQHPSAWTHEVDLRPFKESF